MPITQPGYRHFTLTLLLSILGSLGCADGSMPVIPNDASTIDAAVITPDGNTPFCGNGIIENGEVCDNFNDKCCNDTCDGPKARTAVCRVANGVCDNAESCDGISFECPDDEVKEGGVICRADTLGGCDIEETCDGTLPSCPSDSFQSNDFICREAMGDCDLAETCTGDTDSCPDDIPAAAGTICRADSQGGCDIAESCDGTTKQCPEDQFQPSSFTCRTVMGPCDIAEQCMGSNNTCPADTFVPAGTVCRPDSLNGCDTPEMCSGVNAACPIDSFRSEAFTCRVAADDCDAPETCSGISDSCPDDVMALLVCSDGNICGTEVCDDGMPAMELDGCNTSCEVEEGYICVGEPSVCNLVPLLSGDIVITEIMKNPSAVSDTNGEWFEIHNPTEFDFQLLGIQVTDLGSNSFIINQPLLIDAGGYLVLGRNQNILTNGGIVIDFTYTGTLLGNNEDEIIIENATLELDRVEYSDLTFPDTSGAAMNLAPSFENDPLGNDLGQNWCNASNTLDSGDLGTPGTANSPCP